MMKPHHHLRNAKGKVRIMSFLCPAWRYVSRRTIYLFQTALGLLLAAEIAAVCSLLFAFLLFPVLNFTNVWPLVLVSAAPAGLLVGLAGWKWMPTEQPTESQGVLIGIFGSIAAHPIVWITFAILNAICFPQKEAFADPIAFVMMTFWSLLIVGWITSLVGCVTGSWLLDRRMRFAVEYETDEKRQGK